MINITRHNARFDVLDPMQNLSVCILHRRTPLHPSFVCWLRFDRRKLCTTTNEKKNETERKNKPSKTVVDCRPQTLYKRVYIKPTKLIKPAKNLNKIKRSDERQQRRREKKTLTHTKQSGTICFISVANAVHVRCV